MFVWNKISTQSYSARFLYWGDHVNSVPDLAASPPWSAKIRKSQATINLGTSVQIYNLKVRAPVLYIVALSELKLNEGQ